MRADAAGVIAPHDEVAVLAPGRAPTVADYPLLLVGLAYDCYRVVEGVFWAVSEWSCFDFSVFIELTGCNHRGHHITFAEFVLNCLAVLLGERGESIDFVLLDVGIIDDFLSAGERMAVFRSIRILFLLHKAYFHRILKSLRNVSLGTAINRLIAS